MTAPVLRHPAAGGLRVDMNGRHGWKTAYVPFVPARPDHSHLKRLLVCLVRLYDETGLKIMSSGQTETLRLTALRLLHVASRRPEAVQRDLCATWSDASYLYLRIEDGFQAINFMALPISKEQFLTTTPPVPAVGDAMYANFVRRSWLVRNNRAAAAQAKATHHSFKAAMEEVDAISRSLRRYEPPFTSVTHRY